MSKNKLKKYSEVADFPNVIQPQYEDLEVGYLYRGNWSQKYFENQNPLVLELGCGKGEYTIHLAQKYPEINFIGLDIKGARLWAGGQLALANKLSNVAFVRIDISRINKLFALHEVDEIWVTFPDPQPKKKQIKKRLMHPKFLQKYKELLKPDGIVHLKTDNVGFFNYTLEVVEVLKCKLLHSTHNLYSDLVDDVLSVKTYYEKKFLAKGLSICYLKFQIPAEIDPQNFE